MKSCPTCKRTFEDTFTFCLIDGSVLGAPFEPTPGKSPRPAPDDHPPKTEVLRNATETATLPVVDRAENLNRSRPAPETNPARAGDTNEALPPTIRETNPQAATAHHLEGFATSPLTQWAFGIGGLVGVILAVIYFLHGEPDPRNLLGSLGVFALVGGICILIAGGKTLTGKSREWLVMIQGLIGVLLGLHLIATLFATPIEIGFWMLATGIIQLVTASRIRKHARAWWLLALAGGVSLIAGLVLLPGGITFGFGSRARAYLKLIDAFMFVAGALLLMFGLRLRANET